MHITIAIGTDHRGYDYKNILISCTELSGHTIEWIDVGCMNPERCDYPAFAYKVVQHIKTEAADFGILLCGSGIGMSIAANRFAGIYAGLVWNQEVAVQCRADDSCNVLVIPADYLTADQLISMVSAWLKTTPKEGRYRARIEQIDSWGGL
ncbi:ribose 5-phosphate isomerase B [Candidatus Dependentiae bacterium Noda2021]|nr:ribose 5-phosphate isomerase B [Candidatus Dependentiae bacterium Noda2021]